MRKVNGAVLLPGLAALFALSGAAHAQTGPRFRGDPGALMTEDDYPQLAASEGREGRVSMRLGIDATGRVASCGIAASSGHADLDAKACELMTRRARYAPARDAAGNAVAGSTGQSFRWKLPEAYSPPAYTGSTYTSAATPAYSPAPVASGISQQPTGQQPTGMTTSQQMNADLQRNAAELLARKKKQ